MTRDKLYFTIQQHEVNEGGMARNKAFFNYFSNNNFVIKNFYSNSFSGKIRNVFSFIVLACSLRNKLIFCHISVFRHCMPPKIFSTVFRSFSLWVLNTLDRHNQLFIEINDLPYEQAVDLQLPVSRYLQDFESDILSLKQARFIFAASEMRRFAVEKYIKGRNETYVIVNGAPAASFQNVKRKGPKEFSLRVVYAGTLSRGRQIEDMINIFAAMPDYQLVLLGTDGEWISEQFSHLRNLQYLGSLNETAAHEAVMGCDVGILPYDSARLYYNICFPTKVSFYISAGIPVLSTPLKELQLYFRQKDFIRFAEFKDWKDVLGDMEKDIFVLKESAKNESPNLSWENVIKSTLDPIFKR